MTDGLEDHQVYGNTEATKEFASFIICMCCIFIALPYFTKPPLQSLWGFHQSLLRMLSAPSHFVFLMRNQRSPIHLWPPTPTLQLHLQVDSCTQPASSMPPPRLEVVPAG